MENFCNYFCINWTFSIICCIFWIFSLAEGGSISEVVGSTVILPCKDESNETLVQLTWKTNGTTLFSFKPQVDLHTSDEATRRNIKITDSPPNALLIEDVQEFHSGNYTCEINTDARFLEQKWELIITGKSENVLMITVASVVPCVCCLIFILAWIILHRVRIQRAEAHSPTAGREREEDIYENCLGMHVNQQRSDNQSHCYQQRPR
ncbi:uncharacterized protein ACO6RY_07973 [Pungitius sinensis]